MDLAGPERSDEVLAKDRLNFTLHPPAHARDIVESVERGDTTGVSFAFSRAKDRWDHATTPPTRHITAMTVHELSLTAFPSYEATHVAVAHRSYLAAKEPPMEKPTPAPTEPAPEPEPVVPPETRTTRPADSEWRVLEREHSFAEWIEERTTYPREYAHVRLGDYLRALVTGPRSDLERRVLAEGADATGGHTVPDVLLGQWFDRLRAALVIAQAGATVVPLTSDVVKAAKLLTDPTAAWRSENAAVAESDPAFDAVTFAPKSLDVFFKTSRELLEDAINVAEMIEASLTRSFAVEVDRVCLHGTGTPPQPKGLRTTASVNEQSQGANGAALTSYDPILDLLAKLWAANVTPDPVAILAPRTLTTISKFKTATELAPLPRPPVLADWRFLPTANMPITETQGTSSLASSVFVGDWSLMLLGFRTTMQIETARELFRGNYQVGFFAHLRFDMQLAQAAAFGRLVGIIP